MPASTGSSTERLERLWPFLLALIAGGGWLLRALPLWRQGTLAFPLDYDEGVYFSSAALLWRGVLPYRDFVFVHPPGLLYWLAATSARLADVASGLVLARWVATFVGAINVALVGSVVRRWVGPWGAIFSAALYAAYPDAAAVERGPYLEPLLNAACLAGALWWLSPRAETSRWRPWAAGAAFGLAVGIKLWAGIWCLAALAFSPGRGLRERVALVASGAAAAALVVLPLALAAPGAFLEQALRFHLSRPPDGQLAHLPRLLDVLGHGHAAVTALAVFGALALLANAQARAERPLRFFVTCWLLIVAAFVGSVAYWPQYNGHLAPADCALAGAGGAVLVRWLHRRLHRGAAIASVVVLAACVFPGARLCVLRGRARSPEAVGLGEKVRSTVPAGAALCVLEPADALVAGRLPAHRPGAPVIVDVYAQALLDAAGVAGRAPSANAVFQDERSQSTLRRWLTGCEYFAPGGRGEWQLSGPTRELWHQEFRDLGGGLWERVEP